MPARDIVVIGASAGGLDAVISVVRRLPRNLPAALFIVIHMPPEGPALLMEIPNNLGTRRATPARNGASIKHGHTYVAPPV
jgi:two-component system chemotaxis response regulator CheB